VLAIVAIFATIGGVIFFASRPDLVRAPVLVASVNRIQMENRKTGTTSWRIPARAPKNIEGFASQTSIPAGSTLSVYVRTPVRRFRAFVFRTGWYGGRGARFVMQTAVLRGNKQSRCVPHAPPFLIACRWQQSFALRTGPRWLTGVYLIKLEASDGSQSYVPFILREVSPRAPILFQSAVTTWQAYNLWGGNNVYRGIRSFGGRPVRDSYARAVSFDRPYAWPGDGQFLRFEFPLLSFLEQRGFDVAYATDVDLDRGRDALRRRRVFISAGHDEYYSSAMRSTLERALARGTSLAFFGANDIYRRIRFGSSGRIEIPFRLAPEDPMSESNPAGATATWRGAPISRPEEHLIGAQYVPCSAHYETWLPTLDPPWLYRGTGFRPGDGVSGIVGYEQDRSWPALRPKGLVLVAHSPIECSQRYLARTSSVADTTFYVSSSGAGVFDAGSLWFACALGPGCGTFPLARDQHIQIPPVRSADPRVEQLVTNLLEAMLTKRFA
jgi:hypothetical protein